MVLLKHNSGGSKGGRERRATPLGKFSKIVNWRPHLGEILDLQLHNVKMVKGAGHKTGGVYGMFERGLKIESLKLTCKYTNITGT